MYNITQLQNSLSIGSIVQFANDSTSGMFMGFVLIAIFFISFMTLKRYEFDRAMLASSFVSFVIGAILSYGGYVHIIYPLAFLGFTGLTYLYMVTVGK